MNGNGHNRLASKAWDPGSTPGAGAISPQRRWQLKQQAAGCCISCGQPRIPPQKSYCPICLEKNRAASRLRSSGKDTAWRPGGPVRRPVEARDPEHFDTLANWYLGLDIDNPQEG